jgi:hypothetical protein
MMQKALGATDEEWKALQPRVEKVAKLLMESRGMGGMMMMGGMMGRPGPGAGMGRERFGRGHEEFGEGPKGGEEAAKGAEKTAEGGEKAAKGEKEAAKAGEEAAKGAEHPQSDVMTKAMELHKLLRNKDSKPEDIKKAVADYRAARDKVREELAQARKDLQEAVNPQQEARLVMMGLLD